MEKEIKKESLIKRIHYSTKIEGNSLKLEEVKAVIDNNINARERNVLEVRNYYNALIFLNNNENYNCMLNKDLIFKIHNLVSEKNLKRCGNSFQSKFRYS